MIELLPSDVRPDLAERYRQLRPFDRAEIALVRALVERPHRLPPQHEHALRWALNFARLWVIQTGKEDLAVGPKLARFRHRIRPFAESLAQATTVDPGKLGSEAELFGAEVREARETLLRDFRGRLPPEILDREIREKVLVLVLGGGGACGYIHLGSFALLHELGLVPRLIVGASMGSMMGLFRARDTELRESLIRAATHQLSYKRMFRVLDAETRYALPGALRLHLRSVLSRFFVSDRGETMRLSDLEIPFISVVTGLQREAMRDVQHYEKMFLAQFRKGAFARILHIKDLIKNIAALIQQLYATPGALCTIALGGDLETQAFDVIDAVGFSAAVPAILQYDITRDDPRMHELMRHTLHRHGVDVFADGGLVANLPAQVAWEHAQSGNIGTRNVFLLALDCFAPQLNRNLLFLPLQRVAALNVIRNIPYAHFVFKYRKVMSPTSLVPTPQAVSTTINIGGSELSVHAAFLKKMMTPLPARWAVLSDY
ncbi:MAG: patatin-like phospholipase family protein [Myxococcales bacterium]|nr:patatin-like phospholipase family protein [Myxococcales bacterium]